MFFLSFKSISKYFKINVPILIWTYLNYYLINITNSNYLTWVAIDFVKSTLLIHIMKNTDKPLIKEDKIETHKNYYEIYFNTLILSFFKAFSQKWIWDNFTSDLEFLNFIEYFIYWTLLSFCFELIFDFWHYWFHRILHSNKYLYKWIHKRHHKYHNPSAETTFYMTIPDLILSHCVPLMLSSIILFDKGVPLDKFWWISMNIYLTFLEVGGHIGKRLRPTSSFAQCIWLPRFLGIELYTEDHHLHHMKVKCNYSKRFSIWDKLFGTYVNFFDHENKFKDKGC
tara:strand:+ start:4557 stop:5405 length:849 start_codon:yes stop_codon:yes gene_type:complete